ncbi:mannose-1-phosphate guanyltransferase [Acinetobacter phage Minot]|nr:mannose-1-phosphate guanyltransferase [Acinetobacter phage Minot]QQO96528.1 mannose-1-phosphate guanyltransferase [Acinetobacter phage Mokit]QQO96783.1 nucleotidyltransferase [Acinetobacter phage Melin]
MKKVVILGAGLATRLYPITHHIPKVLVNYKQHTILHHLYSLYTRLGAEQIIVAVHSKFASQVKEYAKLFGLDIVVETVDEAYGSAYAISRLADHVNGHNVVFNWCDVIPDFDAFRWDANAIYTFGDECRYSYNGKTLKEHIVGTGGNVVGVYQYRDFFISRIKDKDEANEFFKGRDFVELIDTTNEAFYQDYLLNLVDLGDKPKLEIAHRNRELNREFNQVTMASGVVYKAAINEKGRQLQKEELAWYAKVDSPALPKILDHRETDKMMSFKMERIIGKPMFEVYTPELLPKILETLKFDKMPEFTSREQIINDYQYEVIVKVMSRCDEIKGVIKSFGDIEYVNNVKIGRLETMLNQAFAHLTYEASDKDYYVIHGDPNFSNLMLDQNGEVRLIDPRGYFGKTKIYGPRIYDEAKVLYALSGYDKFNSDHMWGGLAINGNAATINIEPLSVTSLHSKYFNEYHHLWVAVIWIALAGYFKNNPLKSVSAFYYGMYLLTTALDKMGRRLKDGSVAHDSGLVHAVLSTKNTDKWLLTDLETGEKYRPSKFIGDMHWEKIQ